MPAALARALLLLLLLPAAARAMPAPPFSDLFPEATRYLVEPGPPPVTAVYRDETLLGWVFSSRETIGSIGYSGRSLDLLIGLGRDGRLAGVRLLAQEEPIFASERTRAELARFLADYRGRSLEQPLEVRRGGGGEAIAAVSGATVSSLVVNTTILQAARSVARAHGLLDAGSRLAHTEFTPADWPTLVAEGSILVRRITLGEVAELLARQGLSPETPVTEPSALFAELALALATPPRIGRNLLGQRAYERITGELGASDQLLFVAGRGRYSFKGTSWIRTGSFERLAVLQDDRTLAFTRGEHVRLDELAIAGAPELRELALFVARAGSGFQASEPWRLQLVLPGRDAQGRPGQALLEIGYRLPDRYLRPATAAQLADLPSWPAVWRARLPDLAVLGTALAGLTAILVLQEQVARRPRLWQRLRLGFLLFALLWIGWYASAQLSVVNVLTFGEALRTGFSWDFFLLEPLVFVLWCYVAVALLFWGRGVFCGWLCPFGALQELAGMAARRLGVPQLKPSFWLHERLRSLKFVLFLALFGTALGSMGLAQRLAEVEPFKTAIVLRFLREAPYVGWALLLLAMGLFVERCFCRYLCPLGAALALPARLRQFEWLKRRRQCGRECRICEIQCPVQAIQPDGAIHPGECIHCLRCQRNYLDDQLCPPLVMRRKRSQERGALAAGGASKEPG